MIQVIQGAQHQINFFLHEFMQRESNVFVMHTHKEFPSGFYCMRMFTDYLKQRFGEEEVLQQLRADAAMNAFIYPEAASEMNDQDKKAFSSFSARFESRLNVPYGLFERLAALLSKLIGSNTINLIIPDIRMVDSESLRVIESYYRIYSPSSMSLYLGFTTDVIDKEDVNGIIWERYQGDVQFFAGGFLQYENVQHIKLTDGETTSVIWNTYDVVTAEEAIYNQLVSAKHISELPLNEIRAQLHESYARFSFRAVMKTGVALLERPDFTDNAIRAEVHGLVGSAANFYQFTHHANPPFDDYLMYHLEEALKYETRADVRMALFYRICFTCAERRSDMPAAEKWINQFVEEVNTSSLSDVQRNYHLAWAYNVRGHVYAHTGRFEEVERDGEIAYQLLFDGIRKMEAEGETTYNVWLTDYRLSIFNLTIHQVYTGDEENEYAYSRKWHKRMDEIMSFMPRIMLFDTFHWIDYHRNKFDIINALKSAEEGIQDAIELKHGQIYVYTVCAADFNFRLGNIEKALDYFSRAEKLRPVYNDLFYFLSTSWFKACCLAKLGRYAEAEALFTDELKNNPAPDYRIGLISRLAVIEAGKGNRSEFEALINTAIDEAVDLGELNVLLKVALTSCQCLLQLGDNQNGREALEKVNELIQNAAHENETLSKTTLLETAVCNLMLNGYQENQVLAALGILKEALNDIESWQYLPVLSRFVEEFEMNKHHSSHENAVAEALEVFHFSFGQQREAISEIHSTQV
ncbi:MAG: hypothetical protein IM638_00550 [Bacteroidetes bacterium]|nr:hypothetical protein [Bacteroidota bacterium]